MIRYLLKTAYRNLRSDSYQTILNITGLAIGFAAVLFIATYFFQEYNFDKFHTQSDQIYRVVTKVKMGDTREDLSTSEVPLAIVTKSQLPEVLDATRLYYDKNVNVKVGQDQFLEERFWYADANIFNIFDFKLQKGDKNKVLIKPNTVVITPAFSKKYFGNSDPIGKTIEKNNTGELYEITGVLEPIPSNSQLQFDMLASFSSLGFANNNGTTDWGNFRDMFLYVLLDKTASVATMNQKLQDLTVQYYEPMMNKMGFDYNTFIKSGNFVTHSFQPLAKIHLNTTFVHEGILHGNKQLLYALALIGLMIVVIACFNFINLSTARSTLRAKEIGVKKMIGSGRGKIMGQLVFETFLVSLSGLILAFGLLYSSMSILNAFTGIEIHFAQFFLGAGFIIIAGIFVLVIVTAGIIPAFIIVKFKPVEVLKGGALNWNANSGFRNALVSFQFIIFIVLICGTIVVKKQIHLLHHQNPGFHKENILVIKNTNKLNNNQKTFKDELVQHLGIANLAYSNAMPSMFNGASNPFSKTDRKNQVFLLRLRGDHDYLSTLNIELIDGRNFTNDPSREMNNAIINRKAADMFGWENCNDKVVFDFNNGGINFNVIGIVENFHLESMREMIEPMIFRFTETGDYLSIKVKSGNAPEVISAAQKLWGELGQGEPFQYAFLDEAFDNQYKQEVRFGKLISLFSFFSIFIACLGLLGLVSFTLLRKKKEIGIRKVNGATISEVLTLLNKDFIVCICVAFVIATPLILVFMNKWLENFAYRINLSWWIFAMGGLSAITVALVTVSIQSWQAAVRNPVEALRYE